MYLKKRMLVPSIILLNAYNILPFGLLAVKNLDPLKLVTIILLTGSFFIKKKWFDTHTNHVTIFIFTIIISAINMAVKGKYLDWTLFYVFNYLNYFILINSFREDDDVLSYIKVLSVFSIVATFMHGIYFMKPELLNGILSEIRLGSINYDTSKPRIFIPGMGFIAICFTYLITKLMFFRKMTPIEYVFTAAFFLSIFVFSSVRTNLLGIFICFLTMLATGKLSFRSLLSFVGVGISFVAVLAIVSEELYQFIIQRFDIFLKVGDFQLVDLINLEIDYDNETTWGTVYFRILEVVYVFQNFFNDLPSLFFGNIGTLYDFLGVQDEPAPHVGIVGVFYLFGLTGIFTFLAMIVHFSRIVIRNIKLSKNTKWEFMSIALTVIWFTLIAISFFGGVFYSELILLVTYVMAASVYINKKQHERLQVEYSNAYV